MISEYLNFRKPPIFGEMPLLLVAHQPEVIQLCFAAQKHGRAHEWCPPPLQGLAASLATQSGGDRKW